MDLCAIAKDKNGFWKNTLQLYKDMFPWAPHYCPLNPSKIQGNTSFDVPMRGEIGKYNIWQDLSPQIMPNGVYRATLKLHNKRDEVGIYLTLFIEVYNRLQAETF